MDAGSIPAMSTNQDYTSIRLCFFYPTGGNFCAFGTCEFHSRTRVPLCTRLQRDISTLPECLNRHFPPCPPIKITQAFACAFFIPLAGILVPLAHVSFTHESAYRSVLAIISSPFFLFLFIFQVADNFLLYNSIQIQKPIVPLFHRIF